MQVRSVECMDHHGHNTQCDPTLRPEPVQSCSTGISCTSETTTTTSDNSSPAAISDKPNRSFNEHLDEDVTEEDEEELQPEKPVKKVKIEKPSDEEDEEEDDDEDLNMQRDAPENLHRNTPLAYQYRIPRAERLVDPNAPNEPT